MWGGQRSSRPVIDLCSGPRPIPPSAKHSRVFTLSSKVRQQLVVRRIFYRRKCFRIDLSERVELNLPAIIWVQGQQKTVAVWATNTDLECSGWCWLPRTTAQTSLFLLSFHYESASIAHMTDSSKLPPGINEEFWFGFGTQRPEQVPECRLVGIILVMLPVSKTRTV